MLREEMKKSRRKQGEMCGKCVETAWLGDHKSSLLNRHVVTL